MAVVFPHYCLSFSILAIFRGKWVVKVGPKVQTLCASLFQENSDPSNVFQTNFLFARILPLVRIAAMLHHIWGIKGPKPPKKGHFIDAGKVRKTLKIFKLTTINAILMKLP